MKTSVAKIKKEMLSASEQTKFRICHQLKVGKYIPLSNYCPSEEYDQFLQYVDKADFEGAIIYLHDTILPILKKRKMKNDYEIILSTISLAIHSIDDIQPQNVERKPRTNLNDVARMLSEMDERHADEVHHLFMSNYIDFSDYEFRDEWMMDDYHECFHSYYRSGEDCIDQLNDYVIEILKEWKQDSYHRYQKAKSDLIWWMTDPIPEFIPSLQHDIDDAVDSASDTDNDEVMAQALMHFPLEIADIVKSGNYEDAAANLYYLFDYMAALEKRHDQWFKSLWSGGEMSKIVCFLETLIELYCHLRQMKEVPVSLKDEMDIHLRIFNRKTYFFGDMWGDSRFEDMLLDGKEQFNDYSVLEECSMWKYWYLKACEGLG